MDSETPTLDLVLFINEFPNVFLDHLSNVPLKRKIDFCIDLLPDALSIPIPPY